MLPSRGTTPRVPSNEWVALGSVGIQDRHQNDFGSPLIFDLTPKAAALAGFKTVTRTILDPP